MTTNDEVLEAPHAPDRGAGLRAVRPGPPAHRRAEFGRTSSGRRAACPAAGAWPLPWPSRRRHSCSSRRRRPCSASTSPCPATPIASPGIAARCWACRRPATAIESRWSAPMPTPAQSCSRSRSSTPRVAATARSGRGWWSSARGRARCHRPSGCRSRRTIGRPRTSGGSRRAAALKPGPLPVTVTVGSVSVRDDATPPPTDDNGRWNPWHEIAGPWTFDFELAVAGGVALEPDVEPIESAGITLDLESIVISPTVARAVFSIVGASADEYAPVGTIRHDGKVLEDGGGVVAAGSLELTTGTGAELLVGVDGDVVRVASARRHPATHRRSRLPTPESPPNSSPARRTRSSTGSSSTWSTTPCCRGAAISTGSPSRRS